MGKVRDNYVRVTSWSDEEEDAVNARVWDTLFAGWSEFFAEVCRVLFFDVFYNRFPATHIRQLACCIWKFRDSYVPDSPLGQKKP